MLQSISLYIIYTSWYIYSLIHKLFLIIYWIKKFCWGHVRRKAQGDIKGCAKDWALVVEIASFFFCKQLVSLLFLQKIKQIKKLYYGYGHTILWATPVRWKQVFFCNRDSWCWFLERQTCVFPRWFMAIDINSSAVCSERSEEVHYCYILKLVGTVCPETNS